MTINSNQKKGAIFNEINITPLTDIFLVLLIIMMVIAPLLDQQGLNLAVPQLGAPPDTKKESKTINVEVHEDNNILVEGKIANKNQLSDLFTKLKVNKKDGLIIQADDNSKHKDVVNVMDQARSAGIENITITQRVAQAQTN